jgi:excisionase family DNA binding protein
MMDTEHRDHGTDREVTSTVGQPTDERLAYRPAELAALVGLSTKAIYRAIERGELHAVKVANGSRLLIPAGATAEWLEVNAVAPRRDERPREWFRTDDAGRPLGDALARLEESRGAD